MTQHTKLSRRRFLALGCGALCTAAMAGGCVARSAASDSISSCPFGEVNDPYPGKCHRYTDQSGTGICDYSETQSETVSAPTPTVEVQVQSDDDPVEAQVQTEDTVEQEVSAVATTRCPKGLVNDPYPGRCRHYVDRNGSGFCDLSESV